MSAPRAAELFAGAGGMALGLKRAGFETAWLSEIADFPRRVLETRFAGVPLYGDVTALNGYELIERHGPLDLIAGGSPCQDLSVAGKRKGLAGARSGLIHHQMRLWDETGADLCLWENVAGALSSHNGKDFAAVLSAFVGAAVAVPRDGWTGERVCGVVSGPSGVAAWRLLDAQYFGVPQRRLRIFVLGTRTGRVDPAEVLLEPEGVRWDSPPSREAGEVTPCLPASGAGTSRTGNERTESGLTVVAFDWQAGHGNDDSFRGKSRQYIVRAGDYTGALQAQKRDAVIAFHHTQDPISGPSVPSLGTEGMGVLAFDTAQITSATNRSRCELGLPAPTLNQSGLTHVCVTDVPPVALRLKATGQGGKHAADHETYPVQAGIPRRLMPVECERLMSWPDGWTDVPDEKGKSASDAVRYKAIGNGVASNVAQWIGCRMLARLNADKPNGALLSRGA